jgi:glutamate mutase epsilon subunit
MISAYQIILKRVVEKISAYLTPGSMRKPYVPLHIVAELSLCSTAELTAHRTEIALIGSERRSILQTIFSLQDGAFRERIVCVLSPDPKLASFLNDRVEACTDHARLKFC